MYLIAVCTTLGKITGPHFTQSKQKFYFCLSSYSYTSLGDKTNTVPNPHLKYFNSDTGTDDYHPAYRLKDADALERVGRLTSPQNGH